MKKAWAVLVLILVMFLCVGCSDISIVSIYDNQTKIVEDANTYAIHEAEQSIQNQNFKGVFAMDGMDTLWTYDAPEDMELDITCSLTLYSGKAKLVLISPEDTVTTITEMTEVTEEEGRTVYSLQIRKGQNRIKLVTGLNTELDFDISIPVGTFHEIGV